MVEHGVIQGGKLNQTDEHGYGQWSFHETRRSQQRLIEPGQSKEVVWKFSDKGNIEFARNVPGHYQSGMYGDVNFE